jgi:hypothetical protein
MLVEQVHRDKVTMVELLIVNLLLETSMVVVVALEQQDKMETLQA